MEIAEPRIRVVLVSPGDVVKERAAAKRVVDELNGTIARGRLALWRWESDARPGMHPEGPQGVIDELMDMASADLVIGVFWKRFGTATHDADSGTEHELRAAWSAWRERGHPDVMVYFSDSRVHPQDARRGDAVGAGVAVSGRAAARAAVVDLHQAGGLRTAAARASDALSAARRRAAAGAPIATAARRGALQPAAGHRIVHGPRARAALRSMRRSRAAMARSSRRRSRGWVGSARARSPRGTSSCMPASTTSSRGSVPRMAGRRISRVSPAGSACRRRGWPRAIWRSSRSSSSRARRCAGCWCSTTSRHPSRSCGCVPRAVTAACW